MRSVRFLARTAALLPVVFLLSCGDEGTDTGPVGPAPTGLRAPADLYVQTVAPTQVLITWRYGGEEARGFRVERSVGNPSSFALLDTLLATDRSYLDTSVEEGSTYYYRVRAYLRAISSEPTATVWAIPAPDTPPTAPTSPVPPDRLFDLEPGQVTLQWVSTDPDPEDQITFDVLFGRFRNEMRLIASGTTETAVDVPEPVVRNAHYFWQVTVRDTKGAMRIGPLWGFNTVVDRVQVPPDSPSAYLLMGSRTRRLPDGDSDPFWHPGNPVEIAQFDIDRFEVTNQQFADFLNIGLRASPRLIRTTGGGVYDPAGQILYAETSEISENSQLIYDRDEEVFLVIPGKENFPAIDVTWFGAEAYAGFFGRRLPTEGEWELAARGNAGESGDSTLVFSRTVQIGDSSFVVVDTVTVGFGRDFPWGSGVDPRRCNYKGSGDPYEGRGLVHSTPVGFYNEESHGGFGTLDGSSPYGIHDMAGNVWEWCADWFGPYADPHEPPQEGSLKIVRGGAWNNGPNSIRTFSRSIVAPDHADRAIGFRTVKTIGP